MSFVTKSYIHRHRISFSILIFLCFMFALHMWKPSLLYHDDGSFRQFGIGTKQKTVLPIWIVTILFAIVSYLGVRYYTEIYV